MTEVISPSSDVRIEGLLDQLLHIDRLASTRDRPDAFLELLARFGRRGDPASRLEFMPQEFERFGLRVHDPGFLRMNL